MFSRAVRSIPGALLALLILPLSACDTIGAVGPEAVMDPLNGAVLGDLASFEGKVAVVTGGARGIGFATARLLYAGGAKLVIADVDSDAPAAHGVALRHAVHRERAVVELGARRGEAAERGT